MVESNEFYILTNVATGFVLDSNGAGAVYTHERNGGSYQKWKLIEVNEGRYRI